MIGYEGKKWVAYFWFVGWANLSLGLHFHTGGNIEIHLPFGFVRIGRQLNSEPWYRAGWQCRRNVNMGGSYQ